MLKHGLFKEKGCQGKTQICSEFHPKLFYRTCDGLDCEKGFHLRSISKKNRRNIISVNPSETSDSFPEPNGRVNLKDDESSNRDKNKE